ncbi:molybdopterin molybdotransferase MoeA [Marinobacter sp. F4206]|uniref:molybdopterin molybdotransferase MoeA n=1 Tax=Marinobacter sp. F4206 TaxID=2861777 RepID=UPI001C5D3C7E|nr:gephyrin-like molybdotransferase Glp [Marinobacter sp. F4206]MBW4934280.1 molybdopterin molybdotransferase MoeA [Marinobacter sp. F4206]
MFDCICDIERPSYSGQQAKSLMPVDRAQHALSDMARIVVGREQIPLAHCQGRILARDLYAEETVPPHDNSAMDGYGLKLQDLPADRILAVAQRVPAGVFPAGQEKGTAVRIFTGAPVPAGIDTVVPQEQVNLLADGRIELQMVPALGQNIRRAGEDIQAGSPLLAAGTRLQSAEIGLLASQGISDVNVFAALRVAVVTTGDELVSPGQRLGAGQIYDINSFSLRAALERLGCQVTQTGLVADTFEATRDALANAAESHDLVITTGGVSVGDEDHVRPSVQALGNLHLWGVAMKPGKPFAFGHIGQTPFLGLPGNPMAALVTFEVLAVDFIRQLMGARNRPFLPVPVAAGFARARSNPRQEYLRVMLSSDGGALKADLAGSQSSGVLSVASRADGYLIVPPNNSITEGSHYAFVHRDQLYY